METKVKQNELVKVIESSELKSETSNFIKEKFLPFFEQAEEWKEKARTLTVTDVSQIREMKMAREARLALRDIRINADKTRKTLKEDSLRYGKAVQGVYNVIDFLIVPIEKHLEEQEKFVEILEAKRKAELKAKREIELQPFEEFVILDLDLANMNEENYQKLLNGAKLQLQEKIDVEKKVEAERIEQERKEKLFANRQNQIAPYAQFDFKIGLTLNMSDNDFNVLLIDLEKQKEKYDIEQERIRKENAKLKAEREAKEKQLEKERAEAEAKRKAIEEKAQKEKEVIKAKLKAEREAREKSEAELKTKTENERKAKLEKAEAERKARTAPDKIKLNELALTIDNIILPELKSEDGQKILENIKILLDKTSKYIREKSAVI